MQTKLFEVRDRLTFLPIIATQMLPSNPIERYLLLRSGYSINDPLILLSLLRGGSAHYDPYQWQDRTLQTAHLYIQENWDHLANGQVIDIEFILGETPNPKLSERISNATLS